MYQSRLIIEKRKKKQQALTMESLNNLRKKKQWQEGKRDENGETV